MTRARVALVLVSTVILVITVLAGLTSQSEQASASTQAERPVWADNFVSDYEERHGVTDSDVMTQLLYSSNAVCGDLTAGNSLADVWRMLTDRGQSSDQAGTVIMLSIKYYCPQFDHLYTDPIEVETSVPRT